MAGSGSIKKANNGRWVVRLQYSDADGRRRQKSRYAASHAAAKALLFDLQNEIDMLRGGRVTYRQLDAFYRKEYLHRAKFVGGRKVSGFRQNLSVLRRYLDGALEFFSDKPIDAISWADLAAFKKHVAALPTRTGDGVRSVADTNHFLRRLRRLFNVAVEQGWISENPFSRGSSLIVESFEVERTRIITPAEETRLLAACDGFRRHLRPIIVFAIETGCRRGELQTVEWSHVNLAKRSIRLTALNTKTLKSRLVPISDRLAETLAEQWQNSRMRESDLVFGRSDFKRAFFGACKAAGLDDLKFHDLRHTAITRMLEAGISPALVMKISGHTQQKTFMRYVNQTESSIYEIAKQLSRAA